jgi:hypothetical protein
MSESNYIKLSRIDVSDGVEQKGKLDYLSWAYCWHKLREAFPDCSYTWGEAVTIEGGSVMVSTTVTVDGQTLAMQLPVMDHRNNSVKNPDSRALNDAYMRCLVKNVAMFGLGIGLYMGGSVKQVIETPLSDLAMELLVSGDFMEFHKFVKSLSEADQVDVFNGGQPGKKTEFKKLWRAGLAQAELFLTEVETAIEEAIANEDSALLEETLSELSNYERAAVWDRLDTVQKTSIKNLRGTNV